MPTIPEALPELGAWTAAGLEQRGRVDLVAALSRQQIRECSHSRGNLATLWLVPRGKAEGFVAHPRRERVWIGRPKGVRRRLWAVSLDAIDGEIVHVSVAHPGMLRAALRKLQREFPPSA